MTGKDDKAAGSRKLPARAARPRDFGAPESKPSRKVALDEVLRTLQDLVGNELNVESPPNRKPEQHRQDPLVAPSTETSAEFATAPAVEPGLEIESELPIADEPVTEIELTALPEEPPAAAMAVPPEGLQQELPNLDPESASTISLEPAPPTALAAVAPEAEPIVTELPELEAASVAEPEPAPQTVVDAGDHNYTPTDIPVLSDIVDEEVEAVALPVEEASSAVALPPQADARKLAIQVAARLNVELRKAGKPVLSSDVIARLAHALEEALAKAGANRDNDALK